MADSVTTSLETLPAVTRDAEAESNAAHSTLAAWVSARVAEYEEARERDVGERWERYYDLWRSSRNDPQLPGHTRAAPGSQARYRFTTPVAQQAVDSIVAEAQEALFGSSQWLDITDDDPDVEDVGKLRRALDDDALRGDYMSAILDSWLFGAIYGTMILKVRPVSEEVPEIKNGRVSRKKRRRIAIEAVHPRTFAIDPNVTVSGTRGIAAAAGVAHITKPPKDWVAAQQIEGVYFPGDLGPPQPLTLKGALDLQPFGLRSISSDDSPRVVEFEGRVPLHMLEAVEGKTEFSPPHYMVEAIVTVANGVRLLRAERNNRLRRERSYVAAPLDMLPNTFWGRGAVEKCYAAQQVLDDIVNAQVHAIYESVYKPLVVDSARVPTSFNITLKSGQTLRIPGGSDSIGELRKTPPDSQAFNITSEFERYINMATGAMDSAVPLRTNKRNATLGGMSLIQAASAKRLKTVLRRLEGQFLNPLVEKCCFFGMEYAEDRYPTTDQSFRVRTSLGLVARELEQQQATQLLQVVPPGSPEFKALLGSIVRATSLPYREAIIAALLKPTPPTEGKEDIDKQLDRVLTTKRIEESTARAEKTRSQAENTKAKTADMTREAENVASANAAIDQLLNQGTPLG